MFLKRNTKVIVSTLDLSDPTQFLLINPTNTRLLSCLENIDSTSSSPPNTYSVSANCIDEDVDRGQYLEPGVNTSYGITLSTGLACRNDDNTINNSILWSGLLTSSIVGEFDNLSYVSNRATTGNSLYELSILVISDTYCGVYSRAIVNSMSMGLNIDKLLGISWSVLAGYYTELAGVTLSGGTIEYDANTYSIGTEINLSYINGRMIRTEVGTNPLLLATTGGTLAISNNASVIPTTGMIDFNSFKGYKLGTLTITGNIAIYLRGGDARTLLDLIKNDYLTGNTIGNRLLVFVLPIGTGQNIVIRVGEVIFANSPVDYEGIFSVNLGFAANNYLNDSFQITVV